MTGTWVGEKTKSTLTEENPKTMTMEEPRRHKKSLLVTAVVACVLTSVVIGAVVASLYFGTHLCDTSTNAMETGEPKTYFVQISDSPSRARVEVRKSERVILTETSSTDERLDHTVTLQDFNRDLQAIKDQNTGECYVFPVFCDFDEAVKISENNATSVSMDEEPMKLNMNRTLEAIPDEVLQHAFGTHIAEFCSDVRTYWLVHATPEGSARLKRKVKITITVWNITITIEFSKKKAI